MPMTMLTLVLAVAAMTYVFRLSALALLPAPAGWLAEVVERVPAPLFAGLAVATLLADGPSAISLPQAAATVAAVVVVATGRRSLVLVLGAGLAAYGVAVLVVAQG